MHKCARVTWIFLYYLSISGNVPLGLFYRVFDSIMHRFIAGPVPAAMAEESAADFPAIIEQNRRHDDGHKSLRFHKFLSDRGRPLTARIWATA